MMIQDWIKQNLCIHQAPKWDWEAIRQRANQINILDGVMYPEEKQSCEIWGVWKGQLVHWRGRKICIQIGPLEKTSPTWWPGSKDLGAWGCSWKDRCKTPGQKHAEFAWVPCVAGKGWNGGDQRWHRTPFWRALLVQLGLWLLVNIRKEVTSEAFEQRRCDLTDSCKTVGSVSLLFSYSSCREDASF